MGSRCLFCFAGGFKGQRFKGSRANEGSGAVLALEAASLLGDRVTKLYLYEPPFIINDSRKHVPADYVQQW